jgi:hypothetical protein
MGRKAVKALKNKRLFGDILTAIFLIDQKKK